MNSGDLSYCWKSENCGFQNFAQLKNLELTTTLSKRFGSKTTKVAILEFRLIIWS